MDQHSMHASILSSSSNQQSQVFGQYKEITARLKTKTRSLIPSKKINLQDVSDQFVSLSKQVSPFSKAYEGHCVLAAARTERLIPDNRINNEFQLLLEAARSFRDDAFDTHFEFNTSQQQFNHSKSHSIDSAVSCYRHALKICHESMVSVVLQEMAKMYQRTGDFNESGRLYFEAGLYPEAASSFIQRKDFIPALTAYEKVQYSDLTAHDLITIYLLKLAANDIHVLKVVSDSRQLDMKSNALSQLRLKSRQESMRRLSSVNIPDFFVSISFPVIPLVLPGDQDDRYQKQIPETTRQSTTSTSGESSDQTTPTTSSGYGSKGYQELLLMNEDTLSLNVLLESLYYLLIEAGSDLKLLVNSYASKASSQNSNDNSGDLDDEDDDIDYDKDRPDKSDSKSRTSRNPLREARDQLFNQLIDVLKHEDHQKLIFAILKPHL